MPDLTPIEDGATVLNVERIAQTPTVDREPTRNGLTAFLSGPIFTRTRDIVAANVSDLLDRSEDPARMIRMIIVEMEETLVEVRATAARSIADLKDLRRACDRLDRLQDEWSDRAELALDRGREDLARAALSEKRKATDMVEGLHAEIAQLEAVLRGYEGDIQRLQAKLAEARARQQSIETRMESAITRAKARELVGGERTAAAFARFELLERRADLAESVAEAAGLGSSTLEEELAALKSADAIDAELNAMKAALAAAREKGN